MGDAPVVTAGGGHIGPIGFELELAIAVGEALQVVRRLEGGLAVDPLRRLELGQRAPAGLLQRPIDEFARAHVEALVLGTDALGEGRDDVVVGAALARRIEQLGAQQNVLVAAALIEVVVLDEHGRGQHDVGEFRRCGHEMLVHAHEQILARKARLHLALLRRDLHRVHVLDEQRRHGRPIPQVGAVAREHGADARHVERAHLGIERVEAFDEGLVPVEDGAVIVEGAATFVQPSPRDRRDAQRRVHVVRTVALAGEAVAQPEERARGGADEAGKAFDLGNGEAGDGARPLGRLVGQMRLEFLRHIGVAVHVVPVGEPLAEQYVHDGAGERAVGAGLHAQRDVGLGHGAVLVDVDGDDLGAALLPRLDGVMHDVDLGVHRVGAPDHDQIGFRHLARIDAGQAARAGDETRPGERRADGGEHLRVLLHVAQAIDAVAHDEAHGAGIVIGPHRLGAVAALGGEHGLGGDVEGRIPGDPLELLGALLALAAQGVHQAVGMMQALGIARDLGADDTVRVRVLCRSVDAADAVVADELDVERAGGGAIVRAGRMPDLVLQLDVHRAPELAQASSAGKLDEFGSFREYRELGRLHSRPPIPQA